jgi:polar amino acid transport system permease protein
VSSADTNDDVNPPTQRPDEIRAAPLRHPGRWVAAAIIAVFVALMIKSVVTNDKFQWDVVWDTLWTASILHGMLTTLLLTAVSMIVGVVLGVIVAVGRLSKNPLVWGASAGYAWLFRGVPVLVQLLFWNFIAAIYPQIGLDPIWTADANSLITPFMAAILGLGLSEAGYMSEIVRAGILSVDEGQEEAAKALGMTRFQTMRRVILPQAMRLIVPPTGNETISMLKTSSLVSVIAYTELLYAGQLIYARTYEQVPVLIAVSIWYLLLTSLLSIGQYYIERYYGRGSSREQPDTPFQRIRRGVFGWERGKVRADGVQPMTGGGGGEQAR